MVGSLSSPCYQSSFLSTWRGSNSPPIEWRRKWYCCYWYFSWSTGKCTMSPILPKVCLISLAKVHFKKQSTEIQITSYYLTHLIMNKILIDERESYWNQNSVQKSKSIWNSGEFSEVRWLLILIDWGVERKKQQIGSSSLNFRRWYLKWTSRGLRTFEVQCFI